MVDYMNKGRNTIDHWRTDFLHSVIQKRQNRKEFWTAVVKAALDKLRREESTLDQWHNDVDANGSPKMTNSEIKSVLTDLLSPSVRSFFSHRVVTECLQQCAVPFINGGSYSLRPLPFLLIIDEAAFLFQANYMHSFSWVLDEPLIDVLCSNAVPVNSERFFVLMLGTHSQISHFAPDQFSRSERYFEYRRKVPSVFLSLGWDSRLEPLSEPLSTLEGSAHIKELVQWGRPLWSSLYDALQKQVGKAHAVQKDNPVSKDLLDAQALKSCIQYAKRKLSLSRVTKHLRVEDLDTDFKSLSSSDPAALTTFAILAIRLHLDLDFVFPSRASRLVSSAMRWLVDVTQDRKHIVTTYGSEPILAEAAAFLMHSHQFFGGLNKDEPPVTPLLEELLEQLNQGHVDRGSNGELTARILCIYFPLRTLLISVLLAKDTATIQAWKSDPVFQTQRRENDYANLRRLFNEVPEETFLADIFYKDPPVPRAFFHRAVKVKGIDAFGIGY